MFLVVAVIRVDDVEELADLVLQLVGLGFGIVETVVCDRIRRGSQLQATQRLPRNDSSRFSTLSSNFSLNLCMA
jgi:hypothetical protein